MWSYPLCGGGFCQVWAFDGVGPLERKKTMPQGLKPLSFDGFYGTAKAVPLTRQLSRRQWAAR